MIRSKQQQSAQQNMRRSVGVLGFKRFYEAAFKIQVLDSYWHDKDCRQNQRATARKYGIHLSQIQKWLQCEEKLRNSVKKETSTRRFFDTAFKIKVLDSYRRDKDCRQDQKSTARKYGIDCRYVQRWLQCEEKLRNSVKDGNAGQAVSPATASPATASPASVPKSESNATEVTGSTVTSAAPALNLNLNLNLAGQHGDELTAQQGPPQSMIKTERASSDTADSGNSPSSVRHVDCSVHLVDCTRAPTSASPYSHVHAHERAHTCSPLDPEKPIPSLLHEQKIEPKESEESEEMQAERCRTLIKEEVNLDEEEACNEGEEVTASSCFDYQQYKRPPVGESSPSSSGPVSPTYDRNGHFSPSSPRDSPSAERSRNIWSDSEMEMEALNDLEIDARIARWQTALNRVRQYRRWESERERSVELLSILERYVSKLPKLTSRDLMMMEEDRRQNLKAIEEIEACEREAFGRHVSRVDSVKVHDPIDGHEIADVKLIISTILYPRRPNGAHRPFRVTLDFRDDQIFADAAVIKDEEKIEKSSEVASDNEEVATSPRSFAPTGGAQSEATASGERESRDLLRQLADLRDGKGVSGTTDGQRRETRKCPSANRTAVPSRKAPEQSSTPADSTTRVESTCNPESSEPESDVALTRKDTYRVRFKRDEGEWIATSEAAGERRAAKTARLRNREIYEEELVEYRDRRAAARLKSRKSSTARSSRAAVLTGRMQTTAALASPQATSARDGAGARDVGRRRTNRL